MSRSLNKVFLIGNAGKIPEMKSTAGGTMVANLSIATTERRKDSDGNWHDDTTWHNLVAFGRTAEIIRDYVQKGSPLHIEGRISNRSWDDKETGKKVYRSEVVVENLILLGGNREKTQAQPQPDGFAPEPEPEQDDDFHF